MTRGGSPVRRSPHGRGRSSALRIVSTPLQVDPAPLEPEDLVSAQGRQEEQAKRSTVARLIEASDERSDLLVRKDARARGLVLLRHAGSGILLQEALSDRPAEEAAEGAKRTVARGGSVLRQQDALDIGW